MKFSRYLIPTLREAPSDADNVSAQLMQRAGMIRKVASGIYDWLPLGLRALRKVERIVREEMDAIGGQEVWLPVIQPKAFWEETGRWGVYGKELLRLKDRKDAEFCFAPTAEEVITDLVRREVRSWRQLPTMFYQFGLKFRDEIRPRFGVMRAREFLMKDAYSFHADEADASAYYKRVYEAYKKIFTRCGLKFKPVEAQSGAIGGSFSHEFMVLGRDRRGDHRLLHQVRVRGQFRARRGQGPVRRARRGEVQAPDRVRHAGQDLLRGRGRAGPAPADGLLQDPALHARRQDPGAGADARRSRAARGQAGRGRGLARALSRQRGAVPAGPGLQGRLRGPARSSRRGGLLRLRDARGAQRRHRRQQGRPARRQLQHRARPARPQGLLRPARRRRSRTPARAAAARPSSSRASRSATLSSSARNIRRP